MYCCAINPLCLLSNLFRKTVENKTEFVRKLIHKNPLVVCTCPAFASDVTAKCVVQLSPRLQMWSVSHCSSMRTLRWNVATSMLFFLAPNFACSAFVDSRPFPLRPFCFLVSYTRALSSLDCNCCLLFLLRSMESSKAAISRSLRRPPSPTVACKWC